MMAIFARSSTRFLCLFALMVPANASLMAQGSWYPGQSVRWQRAQAPFTPGDGAIAGGPGNDPNPGSPMYVCRAMDRGSLVPGKWVSGNCNVAFNNREDVMSSYEVAYGNARWGGYQGSTAGLVQTGHEADGRPLYSCRVHYTTSFPRADYGYQPGKLVSDGTCHIPFGGGELVENPPFDVLYGSGGAYPPYPYPPYPYPVPYPYPAPPPAPLPGCRLTDPGVVLNSDGLWVAELHTERWAWTYSGRSWGCKSEPAATGALPAGTEFGELAAGAVAVRPRRGCRDGRTGEWTKTRCSALCVPRLL